MIRLNVDIHLDGREASLQLHDCECTLRVELGRSGYWCVHDFDVCTKHKEDEGKPWLLETVKRKLHTAAETLLGEHSRSLDTR